MCALCFNVLEQRAGLRRGVKMGIGHGEANMLNPINIIKGRMSEAHFAQQNKTTFLLNCYKVFQFIGVGYGAAKRTGPPQERAAKRLVINIMCLWRNHYGNKVVLTFLMPFIITHLLPCVFVDLIFSFCLY